MVVFSLSCFGLLLYLWLAFGGAVPLKPKGYRFEVAFTEATNLSEQAEVRISGVPVGKVVRTRHEAGRTRTVIELERRYAPLPSDARAILRSKTLLGETYVELTPGSRSAPPIPENGELAIGRLGETVELDEVLRTFDAGTRAALQNWLDGWEQALRGRGRDLSAAAGSLAPFAEDATSLLDVVETQRRAVRQLVRDGGTVLAAIGRRDGQAARLISAADAVLATTASRDAALRDTVRVLPTTLRELRPTLTQAAATSSLAAPVLRDLRPVAGRLEPALRNAATLAPDLEAALRELGPLITRSRTGLPALTRVVRAAGPLVEVLYAAGRELPPVVDFLGLYKEHLTTMFANVAAATQDTYLAPGTSTPQHYLRVLIPVWTEGFATAARRLPTNRHNPYLAAGALAKLATGLEAFDCRNTGNPATLPALGSAPPCKEQAQKFPRLLRDGP